MTYEEFRIKYPSLGKDRKNYEDFMSSQSNKGILETKEDKKDFLAGQTGLLSSISAMPGNLFNVFGDEKSALEAGEERLGLSPAGTVERDIVTKQKEAQVGQGLPKLRLGLNAVPEYTAEGTPDYALGGMGRQEFDTINLSQQDLNEQGKAKLAEYTKEQQIKGEPVLNPDIFTIEDFKTDVIAQKGGLVKQDGVYRNAFTGGILPEGVTFDTSGKLRGSIASAKAEIPGKGPITFGGAPVSRDVADVLAGLQSKSLEAGTGTAVADAAQKATGADLMAGLESSAGLLAKVMMMRGLLDNTPQVQAAAPRGATGLSLQEEDLYKKYRGLV
jgi:hypothetical protein